jgi:hypothetical protein
VRKWRSRFTVSGTAGLGDAPRPGRRKADLVLTDAERELTRWARRTKTSQVLALRAKIVLVCADGRENKAVAALLRTSEHNVARWRGRFFARRLDGLGDEKRPRPAEGVRWPVYKTSLRYASSYSLWISRAEAPGGISMWAAYI